MCAAASAGRLCVFAAAAAAAAAFMPSAQGVSAVNRSSTICSVVQRPCSISFANPAPCNPIKLQPVNYTEANNIRYPVTMLLLLCSTSSMQSNNLLTYKQHLPSPCLIATGAPMSPLRPCKVHVSYAVRHTAADGFTNCCNTRCASHHCSLPSADAL